MCRALRGARLGVPLLPWLQPRATDSAGVDQAPAPRVRASALFQAVVLGLLPALGISVVPS